MKRKLLVNMKLEERIERGSRLSKVEEAMRRGRGNKRKGKR